MSWEDNYLELFVILLASKLVGHDQALHILRKGAEEPKLQDVAPQIYWRTKVSPYIRESEPSSLHQLLFVDFSLDLRRRDTTEKKSSLEETPLIMAYLGVMIQTETNQIYRRSDLLTLESLKQHCSEIRIDIRDNTPEALASLVGQAFLRGTLEICQKDNDQYGDSLLVRYEEFDEEGSFSFGKKSCCRLDVASSRMLMANLMRDDKIDKQTDTTTTTRHSDVLDKSVKDAFLNWKADSSRKSFKEKKSQTQAHILRECDRKAKSTFLDEFKPTPECKDSRNETGTSENTIPKAATKRKKHGMHGYAKPQGRKRGKLSSRSMTFK